jgi:hypothetical protein
MTELRFLTPAELRASTPPDPEWLWEGYVAAGTIALFAGKPKAGKSTLAFALAESVAAGADAFLGRPITRTGVVYVSEESAATVLSKLPTDDVDRFHVLTRDAAWPRPEWPQLVAAAAEHAIAVGARLLVIDTAAYWTALPAEREKDAGAVGQVMLPLVAAARRGLAVLIVHHQRKGGGEDGEAIRGSSAWAGSVDVILELERPGDDAPPHHRVLLAVGRFPQTPPAVLIDRDPATGAWAVRGQPAGRRDARDAAQRATILDALPTTAPGLTRPDIEEATGLDWRKLSGPLAALLTARAVTRDGAGRRGDPHRYRKTVPPVPRTETDSEDTNGGGFVSVPPTGVDTETKPAANAADSNGWQPATPDEEHRIAHLLTDHEDGR